MASNIFFSSFFLTKNNKAGNCMMISVIALLAIIFGNINLTNSLPDPRQSNYEDSGKFNPFASTSTQQQHSQYNNNLYNSRDSYASSNNNNNAGYGSRTGSSSTSQPLSTFPNGTSTSDGQQQLCTDGTTASGAQGGCKALGLDMKKISLELIRHDILRKLRMDENRLPNITAKDYLIPPGYLSELYLQNDSPNEEYFDDEHATTEKIIAFSRIQAFKMNGIETGVHYFTFSDKLSNMRIESAILHIHVKFNNHNRHHHGAGKPINITIKIKELIAPKKRESPILNDYGTFTTVFTVGEYDRTSNSAWVQFNVRDSLAKWLAGMPTSSRRIGLIIEAVHSGYSADFSLLSSTDSSVNWNPFLEVQVSERGKSRPARNIGMVCDEHSQETRCCRFPLTVDFDDFGWDWIIAPKKYDANYCSGECPYAFLQKYPHNHIVQQAIPTGVGGPCCAARKLSSITMLYFDQDSNIVFSNLPGMVVDKCGCS